MRPVLPYTVSELDKAITRVYQDITLSRRVDIAERIAVFSEYFLGRSYCLGALGEGPEGRFDQSALYRCDMFDCVTFVNTVLALAQASHLNGFKRAILKIAYHNGEAAYQYRHHFMSVDWNKHNSQLGLVEDITTHIVDHREERLANTANTIIDRPNWFRGRQLADIKLLKTTEKTTAEKLLTELHDLSKQTQSERSELAYLPLEKMFDHNGQAKQTVFDQIPDGCVIEIVRPNWQLLDKIGTDLNVSHVGFVLRKDKALIFRHASSELKRIVDVFLKEYLYQRIASPTIKGINVQKIMDINL